MDETFRVIVAGSRDFNDWNLLKTKLDIQLHKSKNIEIVSGKCPPRFKIINGKKVKVRGADRLGEIYARINRYKIKLFPADWKKLGLKAGPIRNRQMAEYAHALSLFWDGKSRGSASMKKEAEKRDLMLREVIYK